MNSVKALNPLMDAQALAAMPEVQAWVAASAGTGKTQVLSARVLRLLLQGTPPHAILCLTFTKLAAAEMQTRVFGRLARWARAPEAELVADLVALRAETDEATIARARRLFARLLDSPQGLAVQTIHAFAQGLIASFPIEAGVAPGFATLDDRAGLALRRRLLTEAIEQASAEEDTGFLDDLAAISISGGEMRLAGVTARLTGHDEMLAGLPLEGFEPMLRRGFGLPADEDWATALGRAIAGFDRAALDRLALAMAQGGKNALARLPRLQGWLAATDKVAEFEMLAGVFLTQKDTVHTTVITKAVTAFDAGAAEFFAEFGAELIQLRERQRLFEAAAHAARHLRIGKRLAAAWREAKSRLGVIDYDDMIAAAQRVLTAPGAAEWVRYKLDQRIDHVLVDEAQDTNERQWEIIHALSEEFFAGQGARDVQRSLFVVGDFKQSIFSFQGADPDVYRAMRGTFENLAGDVGNPLQSIALSTNFRSVAAVLDVVDAVAAYLGPTALDDEGVPPHVPHRVGAGAVTLWPPLRADDAAEDDDAEGDDAGADDAEDSGSEESPRALKAEVQLAHRIARTIAAWMDPASPLLIPSTGKPARPQDILVLVRRRTAFSGALVAALHANGVPVAGVDRLKLAEQLAVEDLLALARFALQPGDDLTLAALLVSPFIGLSHDELFALAHYRSGSLWDAVRASAVPAVVQAHAWLGKLLSFADFTAPYEFFETVLSGELQGRRKLLGRLGAEARDAMDAVLDQALAFEATGAPSLQGFLAWVEAEDVEIKRDPDAPLDAVRLMTVHGAKGLQAPIVILADATAGRRKGKAEAPLIMQFDNSVWLPVFLASSKGLTGNLAAALDEQERRQAREHCRLLYVALTRAEDLMFIGGALGSRNKEPPEDSWYAAIEAGLEALGAQDVEDRFWGGPALVHATGTPAPRQAAPPVDLVPQPAASLPGWVSAPAPQEARPPRPLSPSAIAADDVAAPPAGAGAKAAARRGAALHALFERLPELEPARRRTVGEAFVRAAVPEAEPLALVETAMAVLEDPRFAAVFSPDALAEAPIAALVGNSVIAGKVDRLLIAPDAVTLVDFKTGRRVPESADAVDVYHLRQMAAYVAALEAIFPGRTVTAALLFTEGPTLIELPAALLALHRPEGKLDANGALNDSGAAPILLPEQPFQGA